MSWPTLAQIKTRLSVSGTSDDSLIQSLLDATIEAIESYCNRIFLSAEYTESFDAAMLTAGRYLVNNPPITALTASTGLDNPDAANDYEIAFDSMSVAADESATVTYTGGYETIPYQLCEVVYAVVRAAYAANKLDHSVAAGHIKSESVPGVFSTTYADNIAAMSIPGVDRFSRVLSQYTYRPLS